MYQLIPRSDPENSTSAEDLPTRASPESPSYGSWVPSWAVIACIVCTVANFASIFIFYPTRTVPHPVAFLLQPPRLTRQEISRLRHPSQFIGLNRIHPYLSSDVKPFVNTPFLSSRIDASSPHQSFFAVDQRSDSTPIGTVFLEHHHVMMTPTVSTILQFHPLDYAMDACELRISLPTAQSTHGDVGAPSFRVSDLPVTLRLSQLDMSHPLTAETVSYRTQPRTLHDIADFTVHELPAAFSHNFTCKMEEVLTFKLGCPSPGGCHVEWWQDHGDSGIALIQRSSL